MTTRPVLKVLRVPRVPPVLLLVPIVLSVLPISAEAQDAGTIAGRVVDGASGRPVTAAIVTLGGANVARVRAADPERRKPGPPRILTGGDGRFVFRNLPIANFSVTAEKPGYAAGANGRRRPGGASRDAVLTTAQPAAEIVVRIWKHGSISGTLTDEAGEVVVRAQLRILQRTMVGGARRFAPTGVPALTDDRGIYRFGNLLPGDYIVVVSSPRSSRSAAPTVQIGRGGVPGAPASAAGVQIGDAIYSLARGSIVPPPATNGRLMVYPTTFYPSAPSPAEAALITLGVGEEKTGVDVQVQPVSTARVSGTVMGPEGPAASVILRLRPNGFDDAPLDQDVFMTVTDTGGGFVFLGVPSGQYSLRAMEISRTRGAESPIPPILWTNTPISVGADVDGVVAIMRPGLSVSARQEFQGAAEPPQRPGGFQPPPFVLEPIDSVAEAAPIGGLLILQGQITLTGVTPGRYFVRVRNSPPGWMFKSAMLNGVDVSETPLELTKDVTDLVLTFTDRWSGIGGTVRGNDGNLDTTAMVVVFPTNAGAWKNYGTTPRRLKSGATNATGEFGISSLPPGDYYAVAIPEDQSDDWRDPQMLDALSRVATAITIVEGEHKTIALQTKDVHR